jgi:hypothetical protein
VVDGEVLVAGVLPVVVVVVDDDVVVLAVAVVLDVGRLLGEGVCEPN